MKPFTEIPLSQLRKISCVLADIDDTMTTGGTFPSISLAAMERLQDAGIRVIPVTGRPAGWCDHIARMWPVSGVVGENGAFYFAYDRNQRRMHRVFARTEQQRKLDRIRLDRIKERILREIPGAGVASDQDYRIVDLAIDFCEDVAPLSDQEIRHIVRIFEASGATAKISSIHVNGWFGSHDKLTMARTCLQELFDIDLERDNESVLYIGDSPNDEPMFSFFANSVGVANVTEVSLSTLPQWVAGHRSARGFVEVADLLLQSR